MNNSASASRRTWNRVMNALVWASAVLVIVLVAGILGMVLVRGIPHISWKFLTTTASVLKGTDGILPALRQPDAGDHESAHHHPHHPGIPENGAPGLP